MILLVNKIYKIGGWLKNFLDVTVTALTERNQAKIYSNHRTIGLLSHTGNIVVRILTNGLESHICHPFQPSSISLLRVGNTFSISALFDVTKLQKNSLDV